MRRLLLFFLLMHLVLSAQSQNACGTSHIHEERVKQDSSILSDENNINQDILNVYNIKSLTSNDTLITIPIVVHIIHKGEPVGTGSNLSTERIKETIKGMNDRYRGQIGYGVDTKIEFCLAKRDPYGNYTNGINRVQGSSLANFDTLGVGVGGANEKDVKALSAWPVKDYYNIWVVHHIVGYGGYAYFPGSTILAYDGTLIRASNMQYSNTVLAHELGHGFNLYHVFDRMYQQCIGDSNCSNMDDRVCDTPPVMNYGSTYCEVTAPCKSKYPWDNTKKNIMNYCGGLDRFTEGQADRMRAAIPSTVRKHLVVSKGCLPVHNNDMGVEQWFVCDSNLQVSITNFGANTITSANLNLEINDTLVKTVKWTGSIKSLQTDTLVLYPNVLSNSLPKNLRCWVSDPNGFKDTINHNDTIVALNRLKSIPAGVYTIGGNKPDYLNLSEAVEHLNKGGICGAVTFKLRSGTYNEQVRMVNIQGTSSKNTITFIPENGKNTVNIQYPTTKVDSNYIIGIHKSSYITFKELNFKSLTTSSFSTNLSIQEGSHNITVEDCRLEKQSGGFGFGYTSALVYSKNADSLIAFRNNFLEGGSCGFYLEGHQIKNEKGLVVENNEIKSFSYAGVYLKGQESATIKKNTLWTSTATYGIFAINQNKQLRITQNSVTGGLKLGIKLDNCQSNKALAGRVSNNIVQVNNYLYNAGITVDDCQFQDIIHNSVYETSNDSNSKAFHCYRSYNLNINNNIFACKNSAYPFYIERSDYATIACDYNNLHSNGNNLAFANSRLSTFASYKSTTGFGTHSKNVDPQFNSDTFLLSCIQEIDGTGMAIKDIDIDFVGHTRDKNAADIGAYEIDNLHIGFRSDTLVCDSVVLSARVKNAKYRWSTSDTTLDVTVFKTGLYWVNVTNSCGTTADSILVKTLSKPKVFLGHDTLVCDSLSLSAQWPYSSHLWSTGDTLSTILADSSGSFFVRVKNKCGETSDTIKVHVEHIANINLGKDTSVCEGITLKPNLLLNNYLWSTGDTTSTVFVKKTMDYWLSSSNICGTEVDSVFVSVTGKPTFSLGRDTTYCGEYTLAPNSKDLEFIWGDTLKQAFLSIRESGAIYAQIQDSFGCRGYTDTVQIDIYPVPAVPLGKDTASCVSHELVANNKDLKYHWNTGDTGNSILIFKSGMYYAQLQNKYGCNGVSDSVTVKINPLPQVDLGKDTSIRKTEEVLLDAQNEGASYLWNDQSTDRVLNVSGSNLDSSHLFHVAVTDTNKCVNTDSIVISLLEDVSIGEVKDGSKPVYVFPNPTKGYLFVRHYFRGHQISLYTSHGQLISKAVLKQNEHVLNCTELSSGLYFFRITDKNGAMVLTKRFVVR